MVILGKLRLLPTVISPSQAHSGHLRACCASSVRAPHFPQAGALPSGTFRTQCYLPPNPVATNPHF